MNDKKNAVIAVAALEKLYPVAECSLCYEGDSFRLLVMAVLSAQCTDKRVNEVSVELFRRYPTPKLLAAAPEGELEEVIRSVGLFNSKAKNLRAAAKRLDEVYGGEVPSAMEDLLSLAGVGRKVANLLRGDLFGLGGIVADTHCIRITNRLGLCDSTRPEVVERTLSPLIPTEKQSDFCHRLVLFGRDICTARAPDCARCPLAKFCKDNTSSRRQKV